MQKVKQMGRQIGIGCSDSEFDAEQDQRKSISISSDHQKSTATDGKPAKQLSAQELKVKKYTEAFHDYFMNQRKRLGIDKALQDSSESEEERKGPYEDYIEEQVDRMLEDRAEQQ